ncbi:hypothetical protein N7540_012268 [Penicillium herquei]|nr:hypothetical protein N7540_012268 [Penicillium herquei]
MAAKQLGQIKNSGVQTGRTPSSAHVAAALTAPGLDFLWYGAKYYEKAILILAKEISHGECSACGLSPGKIYRSGFVSPVPGHNNCDETEDSSAAFRILAACIFCQYEDISATMRAWTGHLDGIHKLIRRYLDDAVALPEFIGDIPQSTKALQTSFWFFALHDVLNSFTLRQPCRLDARAAFWHKMGLPLDEGGQLIPNFIPEQYIEEVFFKALIRVLCKMVSWDLGKPSNWAEIDSDLTRWYTLVPPQYVATISQPLPPSPQPPQYNSPQGTFSSELWFGMDLCAIAMAFYHMARISLLVQQPRELFLSTPSQTSDILSTYNALQRDLHSHATSIVSISSGTTNDPVRKYMLQPLYTAGRCLTSQKERQRVISLLVQIEDDLGLFTEYRRQELSNEWGVAFDDHDHVQ